MRKIRSKWFLLAVILSGIADTYGTHRLGDYLLQQGLSFKQLASAEENWLISIFWANTQNILLGVVLNFIILLILALLLFYYCPKKFREADHTALFIIGLGMIISFLSGFINNVYLWTIATGKGLIAVDRSMFYHLARLSPALSFFASIIVAIWVDNRDETWVKFNVD